METNHTPCTYEAKDFIHKINLKLKEPVAQAGLSDPEFISQLETNIKAIQENSKYEKANFQQQWKAIQEKIIKILGDKIDANCLKKQFELLEKKMLKNKTPESNDEINDWIKYALLDARSKVLYPESTNNNCASENEVNKLYAEIEKATIGFRGEARGALARYRTSSTLIDCGNNYRGIGQFFAAA